MISKSIYRTIKIFDPKNGHKMPPQLLVNPISVHRNK